MPFWEEVDDELRDQFNVAFVDVHKNEMLKLRFHIGYGDEPAIMFFSRSRFYKYLGKSLTVSDMVDFAMHSYRETDH